MKSFAEVIEHVSDSDVEVFGGKEKVAASLASLDSSWDNASRTTLGVMMAVMATAPDGVLAGRLLSGMLTMMQKLSDGWCQQVGWQGEPLEQSEVLELSKKIDKDGEELGGKVDAFGAALMCGILANLPKQWGDHLRAVIECRAGMTRVLAGRQVPYISSLLADVQKAKTEWLAGMANRTVFSPNSKPMARAKEWGIAARSIFDACVAGGWRHDQALAEAIKKVGFPNAMRRS